MKLSRLLLTVTAVSVLGCRQEMRDDSRLKPYQETPFFADRDSSRPLVSGVVPRGEARADDFFYTGKIDGHLVRGFPAPVTLEQLKKGQERYNIYCSVCHGITGVGDGAVVQRGFPRPPSFHDQRLRDAPEGHFFHVMTHGYGVMYSYAARVEPGERWAIIAYIRALQLARNAMTDDVPPEIRTQLAPNQGDDHAGR
ncbi:MAG: cytochrome c [Verrucomicrobia bacterium]|nr:cytochrome c [Verrucomicrobiota bacterium]